jgi:hypothetical protein
VVEIVGSSGSIDKECGSSTGIDDVLRIFCMVYSDGMDVVDYVK